MKVFIARRKTNGYIFYGRRYIYSAKGALKSAMKGRRCIMEEYDILSFEIDPEKGIKEI